MLLVLICVCLQTAVQSMQEAACIQVDAQRRVYHQTAHTQCSIRTERAEHHAMGNIHKK